LTHNQKTIYLHEEFKPKIYKYNHALPSTRQSHSSNTNGIQMSFLFLNKIMVTEMNSIININYFMSKKITFKPVQAVTSIKWSPLLSSHLYQVVTSIKQSPVFSCPVIENFIWIEPLLRRHFSYKTTFSLSQRWPLNTGLTLPLSYISYIYIQVHTYFKISKKHNCRTIKKKKDTNKIKTWHVFWHIWICKKPIMQKEY
jgi:hypothetical protein